MNTRFNPTANGYLHIGHLYVALLNYHQAVSQEGDFICRFDDDQNEWIQRLGKDKINYYCECIKEDFDWLKIPTKYSYESKEKPANEDFAKPLGEFTQSVPPHKVPRIITQDRPYPYVVYLTSVKVAQDYREQINPVIRGEDLTSEFALYCYFCEILNIPTPEMWFVPKLMQENKENGSLKDLSDVSKTIGGYAIRSFREKGYTPEEVIEIVAASCLKDPNGGWVFENVKKQPVLCDISGLWF